MSPREVIELSRECRAVDFTYCDLWGAARSVTLPVSRLEEAVFVDGLSLDGEALLPDPESAFLDPIADQPTLSLTAERDDPSDPRGVARRAEERLRATGIADVALVAARPELFLLRDDGSGLESAAQTRRDVCVEIALTLADAGIEVACHQSGEASEPCRFDLSPAPLTRLGDSLLHGKRVAQGVARQNGLTATFLPKPLCEVAGARMPVSVSLRKDGRDALGEHGPWFLGGLLAHAPALSALAAPTTNSYRVDRSSTVARATPTGVEYGAADPTAHPYLALAALVLAGLDGIERRIEPREVALPARLGEALDALETDHEFLQEGGVFSPKLIRHYIDGKREREVEALRRRPHPHEFALYFGV